MHHGVFFGDLNNIAIITLMIAEIPVANYTFFFKITLNTYTKKHIFCQDQVSISTIPL